MPEKSDLMRAALAYAERGWPIFPVKFDKTPLTKNGVLDATTDLRQIEKWWTEYPEANIALDVGGAGMMVLDFDPGSNIEEVEKNVGKLPKSNLISRTPRGGRHIFYDLAIDEHVSPSSSKLAPHVDIRSFHSYVLLPPSTTMDGAYVWEANGKPAYRTDEMVRVANSAREKHEDRDTWTIEPDLKENIELATSWLLHKAKPAIEEQGGDHPASATAGMMKGYGMSEEKAYELMLEHWDPRCQPSWASVGEEDHLRTKVQNLYHFNTSPPGNLTPEFHRVKVSSLFKPVLVEDESLEGGFRFVSRKGMDAIPEPTWIIDDLLADESYAILYGAYSTFKTFVALDIALTIAWGFATDPSWKVNKPGPVLFAAGEGRSGLAARVRGWEALHSGGHRVENFVLMDPVPLTTITEENLQALVKEALRRHPGGYGLTVIDTLGRAMAGGDENSQRDAAAMTQLVRRLSSELGGSVLALHHSGVAKDDRLRGSSVFSADADTLVRAARRGKEFIVSLRMDKQKDGPEWKKEKRLKIVKVELGESWTYTIAPAPPLTLKEQTMEQTRR